MQNELTPTFLLVALSASHNLYKWHIGLIHLANKKLSIADLPISLIYSQCLVSTPIPSSSSASLFLLSISLPYFLYLTSILFLVSYFLPFHLSQHSIIQVMLQSSFFHIHTFLITCFPHSLTIQIKEHKNNLLAKSEYEIGTELASNVANLIDIIAKQQKTINFIVATFSIAKTIPHQMGQISAIFRIT